jgi:uncharacterized protein (TIGR02099 family)
MQPEIASTTKPLPPRLKLWSMATQWLLVLVLSCALLLGLGWALLHWLIVPRIDEFRPALQSLTRQTTGLPIEIGQLQARSVGLIPSFELRQVRLLDAQGQAALQLPKVVVALSPRSVLKLGLEQLVIEGADLEVRRTADGRFVLAGIDMSAAPKIDMQPALDWLFSQTEWALTGGTVYWRDEQQGMDMKLTEVDWVMRNSGQRHHMRLDATPPPQWGDRFSLRGMFRQPLLSGGAGNWKLWSGELYAEFGRIEAAPLRAYGRLAGVEIEQGRGALRSWADVQKGQIVGALADVQLQNVQAQLGPKLPRLELKTVEGRLGWQQMERGMQVRAEALNVEGADGTRWAAGQLKWAEQAADASAAVRHQLEADQIDLASLAALAQRLPLPEAVHEQVRSLQPRGQVRELQLSWQGPLEQPDQAQARGRVVDLALAPQTRKTADGPGRPGVQGANLDFQWKREKGQDSGQAQLQIERGWVELPGLLAEPRIDLDQLVTTLKFRRGPAGVQLDFEQSRLQNSDAQAQLQGSWRRQGEGLGELDLQGQITQANGARVYRYLPLTLPEATRRYLQEAVPQARLSDVRIKVKGPLARFPFKQAAEGEFLIGGKIRNARFVYVPTYLSPGSKPWPALERLEAELQISRNSLQLSQASAQVAGLPGLALSKVQARIAELGPQSSVEVNGDIRGPLAQALKLVQTSPLSAMTGEVLGRANGTGTTDLQLRLNLPLNDLSKSTVQGNLQLAANDLQLAADLPAITQARANLQFTQNSLQVTNAQGRLMGGDLRFEGGLRARSRDGNEPEAQLRVQGQVSAEALRQLRDIPALANLARSASGSTSFSANLGLRQGWLEMNIQSRLQGLALNLPAPLNKPAAAEWPLRIERSMIPGSLTGDRKPQDRITVQLGPLPGLAHGLHASYLRDVSGGAAQILGGELTVGSPASEASPGPVRALVDLPSIDLDGWSSFMSSFNQTDTAANPTSSFMPSVMALRTDQLRTQGHTLQQVVVGASREGSTWRANINATELSGYGEYRPASNAGPGRVYARLARLALSPSTTSNVEALLDNQPSSIPALDIVVDDLELRGRKLGRLEVEALNRNVGPANSAREWRLTKLSLNVPEAKLTATGNWAALPGARPNAPRVTQLNFALEIEDSGDLLKRMGIDGAIRRGKGKLEGRIGWSGSPLAFSTSTLQGQFLVDIETGQFLKAEPGVAKLLGVLNLQSLPRRLTLDFRDLFSEGFAFDWVRGEINIDQGVARTESLRMKGVNAAVLMAGSADITRETQDLRVVVVPEINAGTASLLASAVNPVLGLSTFIAQWLLRRPLNEANTQEFTVRGTWADPVIERVPRKPAPSASGSTPP